MKPWKLAFFALIGAFTLGPSACTVTSDDDDGLDDDDDDGDSGTGGVGGTSNTSGASGNAGTAGNSGAAGNSGSAPMGTVTQFFGEGSACQQCLDTMSGPASSDANVDCGEVVDNCGVGGEICRGFIECLDEEQTEFETLASGDPSDILTCAMVACGTEFIDRNVAEEQDFFICVVDKCNTPCQVTKPLPEEDDEGIGALCPNVTQL